MNSFEEKALKFIKKLSKLLYYKGFPQSHWHSDGKGIEQCSIYAVCLID